MNQKMKNLILKTHPRSCSVDDLDTESMQLVTGKLKINRRKQCRGFTDKYEELIKAIAQ